jgi:hypothetical protein
MAPGMGFGLSPLPTESVQVFACGAVGPLLPLPPLLLAVPQPPDEPQAALQHQADAAASVRSCPCLHAASF